MKGENKMTRMTDRADIKLTMGDLGVDLWYTLELYPSGMYGKYGFSYRRDDADGRCETKVKTYDTKAECVSDMAQNIKNHVLFALGQPEED